MKKRILCMGEFPENLAVAREILEDEGYEVQLRGVPFRERIEIEALSPDLIVLTVTAVADCLGRHTLRLLNLASETASPPVLVWVRAAEDMLPHDQDLMGKGIFILRSSLLESATLLNCIHQASK